MQKIKKGDNVVVLAGKDKGKQGIVISVLRNDKILVEGVNTVKKHQKGNPNTAVQSGIVQKDMPIHISNVGLFNPKTNKADRVGFKFLKDGTKVRYFKSTDTIVESLKKAL
jgi:large subunit ribosomal protein L24